MEPLEALKNSSFGKRTAEEEFDQLKNYFVETDQWKQVIDGTVDVVYGPKGSGKSAIYSLISQNGELLKEKNILVVQGENPQGTPAFKILIDDMPVDQFEFISIWKLYVLSLCGQAIKINGISNKKCLDCISILEEANLIPSDPSLSKALKYAFDYVKSLTRIQAIESELKIDPITGMPTGIAGRIVLREPGAAASKVGVRSVDDLFKSMSDALKDAGYTIWITLDRLDVAFQNNEKLENAALRALFQFYLETKSNNNIKTKIFLRSDIWKSISASGFREASHIERSLNIEWNNETLVNLFVRRAVANKSICDYFKIVPDEILSNFASQQAFIGSIFPQQVDSGPNKPKTFDWILSRTKDGTQPNAPRELIHFLNELRTVQIARLERGEKTLPAGKLFDQVAFKEALPNVSKVRLEQTLFAEYPDIKQHVEAMRDCLESRRLVFRWAGECDSHYGCGHMRTGAGWPRSPRRRSAIPAT
ncbi:MAG: hypothetical protein HEQ16_10975 [Bosea sp.]|nr:hypothetical protein [Bosea sp. (in: a-proteobacteria)]